MLIVMRMMMIHDDDNVDGDDNDIQWQQNQQLLTTL